MLKELQQPTQVVRNFVFRLPVLKRVLTFTLLFIVLFTLSLKTSAQVGSALSFDGSDDYVAVNNPFTSFQKEITVEWWVYIVPNQTYTLGSGIGQGTVGIDNMSNNVWLMHFNGSGSSMQFYVNDAGTWRTHSAVNIPSGWHHLAGVADASGTRLFIDGSLAAPSGPGISTGIWSNTNAKVHFGKDVRFNSTRFMPGTMDEIRIWSRAICQGELQNNKFCEIPGAAPNLEGNYHFNQGVASGNNSTVTSLIDASGNNRHGILTNMALTGTTSNWVTPGGIVNGSNCSPFAYPTATITAAGPTNFCMGGSVTINANTNASFTYQWKKDGANISGATNASYTATTAGNYSVVITNLGCSGTSSPINVVVYTTDTDGDGVADVCDADDDNDGILDDAECNVSNFYWSNPPTVGTNTNQATGTINGISYTYQSSATINTTGNVYNHGIFPASYGIPNNTTIRNDLISTNTLSFASPMKNPVLVFSSIGSSNTFVPIEFDQPVDVLWSTAVTVNSSTKITGNEGYAIVRLNGTYSSIGFKYLANESWVNFVFGADFTSCGDTDNDGSADYVDIDSDNDGCSDAVEGGAGFLLSQTTNNRLTGGVNASGIPLLAGAGQTIGTSKTSSANCSCQANIDRIKPTVITKNLTVQLDANGNATITPAQVNNGSSDACGIESITLSKTTFNCSNVGNNTVTLSVKDVNNNIGTATAVVTVQDLILPTAVAQNLSVTLDINGNATITASQVNNGSTDNCTIASLTLSKTNFNCTNLGANTVTLTVTDASGNSSTANAVITVSGADTDADGIPDVCDLDDDNDGITDAMECNKSNFFWSNPPSVSGNVASGTINGIAYTYTSSLPVATTSSVYNHGIYPTSYGVPNNNPTIRNDYISTNTLSFASPMKNPVLVFSSIGNSGLFVPIEFDQPIQILWSTAVTQNSSTKITGNEGYAIIRLNGTYSSIGFKYLANESWVNFVFGADFTNCGDTDNDGTPDYVDTDSDNDGCSDAIEGSLSIAQNLTLNGRLTGGVNAQGIPLLAGNGQGNGTSQSFVANCFCQPTIDKTLPTVLTKDVTITLNSNNGTASINTSMINNGSTDNCGISTYTLSKTNFNCSNLGPNTVTLTVKDINNNIATGTAIVTVVDNTAPSMSCQSNISRIATSAAGASVNFNTPNASDNCSYTVTQTAGLPSGSTFPIGTTTVTFKAEDGSGNSTSCSFNVTVTGVAPVIVSPGTITVNSNSTSCGAEASYIATETTGIPASTITYSIAPGSTFNVGSTTVTATATNAVGSSQATFNVIVVDNVLPTISCVGNINTLATSAAGAVVSYPAPTGSDNCAYNITQTAGSPSGSTFPIGTSTVTYQIVDASGNSASCSFDITVTGLPPVIVSPGTITANSDQNSCSATVNYAATETTAIPASTITYSIAPGSTFNVGTTQVTATATNPVGTSQVTFDVIVSDNTAPIAITQNMSIVLDANGAASITTADINNGSNDACGIASISLDKTTFNCSNVGANTVVLTVTDVNGNSSTASATVNVSDNTAPIAITQNVSIVLDANGAASITTADINNGSNDACGIASISLDKTTFNCSNVGANTVVLTVTDVNGNSSTASATVNVSDNTAPNVITQNNTVFLDANGNGSITISDINNGSNDACGIASISLDKTNFNCSNVGENTVVLTVTDINGNTATATAIVAVADLVAPNAIARNITVALSGGSASITSSQINNGSNDACGIASISIDKTNFNCENIGANPVVLTVTDVNGNSSIANAVVNVTGYISTCSITATPNTSGVVIGSTTTYASVNQMFLGYGPQSMKVNCTAVNGGPFTYRWTGTGLNNTNIANPIFTPTARGNYSLTCEVTNSSGCVTTCTITICVIDVRAAGGSASNPKVLLCHVPPGNTNNPQTLSISISAVPAHLGLHGGDKLGSCNTSCNSLARGDNSEGDIYTFESATSEIDLVVYPNPSTHNFNFILESSSSESVSIRIFDVAGRLVEELANQLPNSKIELGSELISGSYLAEVTQGENRKTVKLIKLN